TGGSMMAKTKQPTDCSGTCEYHWDGTMWSSPVSHCSGTTCLACPRYPGVPDPKVPCTVFITCPSSKGPQTAEIKLRQGSYACVVITKKKKPAAKKKKKPAKTKK